MFLFIFFLLFWLLFWRFYLSFFIIFSYCLTFSYFLRFLFVFSVFFIFYFLSSLSCPACSLFCLHFFVKGLQVARQFQSARPTPRLAWTHYCNCYFHYYDWSWKAQHRRCPNNYHRDWRTDCRLQESKIHTV